MMYYAWDSHSIRPSEFYRMSDGEKLILRAFYEVDMEKGKNNMNCPLLE